MTRSWWVLRVSRLTPPFWVPTNRRLSATLRQSLGDTRCAVLFLKEGQQWLGRRDRDDGVFHICALVMACASSVKRSTRSDCELRTS